MTLEQTINLTWNQAVFIGSLLVTIGGLYWLLIHIGNEGSKMKETIKQHGEHMAGMRSDVTSLQKTTDRIDRNLEKLMGK